MKPLFAVDKIWQEYDCPASLIDFDLFGDEILCAGESVRCSACDGLHVAGRDGPKQTTIRINGELIFRGIPFDAKQKAVWIAEADA